MCVRPKMYACVCVLVYVCASVSECAGACFFGRVCVCEMTGL